MRASEIALVLVAVALGAGAGLLTVFQGAIARTLQHLLYALPVDARLSSSTSLVPIALLALPIGGAALAAFTYVTRARKRALVDAVEANALHGGRMSATDSLIVSGQTIISNGVGASVGLEAAYAQLGSALASIGGMAMNLRRNDLRTLVGAGAGAAIAAAFGAPLAGAFYAFEIVIGAYTPSAIAPVAAATLTAVFVAGVFGAQPYEINVLPGAAVEAHHYLLYVGLGGLCAAFGILLMYSVTLAERGSRRILPEWARPAVGGLLLIPLALVSPQVLSSGHGALHYDLAIGTPVAIMAIVFVAKYAASVVSLGFGFRGGLFFASLFLGTLLGHLYADGIAAIAGHPVIDQPDAALVGMAALAAAVVGGPLTMSMLVLEATQDVALTGAVVASVLVASTIARETFGYSFSTWRFHLRGETIKSARDVGWVRSLTAGRMMRRETRATPASITVAEFRRKFPLGSTSRVVLVDDADRYAGIAQTSAAYAEGVATDAAIGTIAANADVALAPDMDIGRVMRFFDRTTSDELAVVDGERKVLGLLSEAYVRRRYAEELEKAQRDLFGER